MELGPVISKSGFIPSLFLKPKDAEVTSKTDPAPPAGESDSSQPGAVEPSDATGEGELPETFEQHIARMMSELFGDNRPDRPQNVFEKIRQLHEELMRELRRSNGAKPGEAADAPQTDAPADTARQQSFSIDISVRSVFERMEELVRVAGERRGDRVLAATSSVLRRQSAGLSLDFSFTTQFLDQGIDLAAIDEELIEPFLNAAMGLSEFDDESLQTFMGAVENLFNGLEKELGLQDGMLQANEDIFKKMAQRYFDSVQNILAAPSILDEEGREAVLSTPPDAEYFRKNVADIFRDAGGMDAAKRMVAGQPSDLEILMEKMRAKQKANRKKKKDEATPDGDTEESAEASAVPETVRLAKENMLAVSSGFTVETLFEASRFLGVLSESGSSQPGLVRDVVA